MEDPIDKRTTWKIAGIAASTSGSARGFRTYLQTDSALHKQGASSLRGHSTKVYELLT